MRKLFAAMLVVFLAVGSAYAVDITTTGDYYVRGTYEDNIKTLGKGSDRGPHMYYDHELTLNPTLTVSDATYITMRLNVHDTSPWDQDTDAVAVDADRLWASHKFGTGTEFQGGLQTGGEWASAFGNNGGGRYHVRINQALANSTLVAMLEKNQEGTTAEAKDGEAWDSDSYILAWIGKVGNIDILPLFVYNVDGTGNLDDDGNPIADASDKTDSLMVLDLGAAGEHGLIGWEAEFIYESRAYDRTDRDDWAAIGAYGDIHFNLEGLKVGGKLAYGSYDADDGSFNYGADYVVGGLYILGDTVGFGPGNTGAGDASVQGSTTVTVYGDYTASEALSFFGGFAYLMSNGDEDSGPWDGATAYELYVSGAYKITDAVTYDAGIGYAALDVNNDGDVDDPDPVTKIYHRFKIAF
jgi:hypothetical protein